MTLNSIVFKTNYSKSPANLKYLEFSVEKKQGYKNNFGKFILLSGLK